MAIGILAGLLTCALWGLTFVAARGVAPFSIFDMALARYCVFGATCLASMLHPRCRPTGLMRDQIISALLLGGVGYTGYFLTAAGAVALAGPALPPLITGLMPAILAVVGNAQERSVPWRWLIAPLLLVASGIVIVQWATLQAVPGQEPQHVIAGVLLAVAALLIWVVYGYVNARHMRAASPPDALAWTTMQGIGAVVGSLAMLPFTSFAPGATSAGAIAKVDMAQVLTFVGWAVVMGLAASWLASWCWMIASRRLPLALLAQLVVAETAFALIYGFIFEARWPATGETVGILVQLTGVLLSISVFTRRNPHRRPEPIPRLPS
jgi:drug/metabolite transporter (DMT)-like permease